MSLINDALKKAQRQRTEGNPPATDVSTPGTASSEPLHRVVRREKPAGFRSQLMLIGGGAVAAVILLAVGAVFFFRSPDKPAETPKPAKIAVTPVPTQTTPAPVSAPAPLAATAPATPAAPLTLTIASPAASTAPEVSNPTPAPSAPAEVVSTPTAPAATPSTSSQFVIQSPPPAATASIPAAAPTPVAPPPVERPKPSTRMIGVIEHYKVGGIRVSGTESKVLMNDRVYRINDIVDHELGIRLTGIETKALTFEDARGAVFTRNF